MGENIKTRISGIELMRIIMFFMVVSIHVSTPYLSYSTVTGVLNWQAAHFIDGISRIAVPGFVLITGYFLVTDKEKKRTVQVIKMIIPILFYTLFYFPIYRYENGSIIKSIFVMYKDLLGNNGYYYHMWYMQTIIFIYLFSNYYNILINNINKKQYKKLLLLIFTIASFMPTFCYLIGMEIFNLALLNSRFILFSGIYFLAGYIKKHVDIKISTKKLLGIFVLFEIAIVFMSFFYNYKYSPYIFSQRLLGIELTYPMQGFIGAFYDYNNVLVIGAAAVLFLLVLRLDFKSKIINKIAEGTFGAYIIHVFYIQKLSSIGRISPFIRYEDKMYPLYLIMFIILVGVLSIGTELVRLELFKIIKKVSRKINN